MQLLCIHIVLYKSVASYDGSGEHGESFHMSILEM